MKKIFTIIITLGLFASASAQDTTSVKSPWKTRGMASLNFSQVSLTNWAQGGESSYAVNGLTAVNVNYAKDMTTWENALDLGYGIQKVGSKKAGKTDDHTARDQQIRSHCGEVIAGGSRSRPAARFR